MEFPTVKDYNLVQGIELMLENQLESNQIKLKQQIRNSTLTEDLSCLESDRKFLRAVVIYQVAIMEDGRDGHQTYAENTVSSKDTVVARKCITWKH